jgi:uncharacterized protein YjbI with pentapeptide repeats
VAASLVKASLVEACLVEASLVEASLVEASLVEASLVEASLVAHLEVEALPEAPRAHPAAVQEANASGRPRSAPLLQRP